MLQISNVRVYDLKESVIACRNAMRLYPVEYTDEEFEVSLERAIKLVTASKNSNVKCHDNYLTGIRVSFDLKYTQYITKQFQRYHWFDYVSSSSLMHRITKMNFDECCNEYVTQETKDNMKKYIEEYNVAVERNKNYECEVNKQDVYKAFMKIISNCPMGCELFVRVSTNYKQLQTIYFQRKNHKLKEDWGEFCKFVESLPYAKELILGQNEEEQKTQNSHRETIE